MGMTGKQSNGQNQMFHLKEKNSENLLGKRTVSLEEKFLQVQRYAKFCE